MRMLVNATPSHIRFAAAVATVLSTNNTRVRLNHTPYEQTTKFVLFFRLCAVWLSQCEAAILRVGAERQAPKNHRDRQDAAPQTCLETVQERFQVRCNLSTRYFVRSDTNGTDDA